jgi:hypothetical protein
VGTWRWGDTIDVVCWLYNRTGAGFLLDLVRKIHQYSANWVNNIPTPHNVNITQGFREPAQYWVLTGDPYHRTATYNDYNTIQSRFGQFPGGGFAGDENYREGFTDPRQGFETCGIVEYMLSHEILTRITGDAVWGDRTEELAFNLLPASLDPRGKAIHYITNANCIDLNNSVKTQGQFQNGFAMQSYRAGVDQYRCCPHNYGMGWPYYVEEMWVATRDGGLCAALYGPSTVTARVADGTQITVTETTTYPFNDTITFGLSMPRDLMFPLVFPDSGLDERTRPAGQRRSSGGCRRRSALRLGQPHVAQRRSDHAAAADAAAGAYLAGTAQRRVGRLRRIVLLAGDHRELGADRR